VFGQVARAEQVEDGADLAAVVGVVRRREGGQGPAGTGHGSEISAGWFAQDRDLRECRSPFVIAQGLEVGEFFD
jgi:hypothetical protein